MSLLSLGALFISFVASAPFSIEEHERELERRQFLAELDDLFARLDALSDDESTSFDDSVEMDDTDAILANLDEELARIEAEDLEFDERLREFFGNHDDDDVNPAENTERT